MGAGFADILLKAAALLALWERAAVMLGVAGTLLTDAAGKFTSPSASLSSLEDGARLAFLLEGAGGRTDRAAGVGGTAWLVSNLKLPSNPSFSVEQQK
jgi:hypothetical protein